MTVSERSAAVRCSDSAMFCAERGQVPLAERHDLRTRRRAGRVEHERFVVGRRSGRFGGGSGSGVRSDGRAWSRPLSDLEVDREAVTAEPDDQRLRRRGGQRGRRAAVRHEGRGAEVVQVEAELLLAVLRVQRRRGADRHGRQQDQRHLRPVRQDDGDPVTRSEARRTEAIGQPVDRLPEGGVVDRLASDCHQGRARGLRREEGGNGVAEHEAMIARRWRLRLARPTLARCACASSGPGRSAACSRRAWPWPERRSACSARGATLAAIRDTGLTLVEPDGSVVAAPTVDASDDLAVLGPQDVVVLSLKAHQITAIADRLEALYDEGTVVVPVQNGVPWWFFQKLPGPFEGRRLQSLDPDGTIERHVPPHRIIGCIAYPAAEREQPAVIRIVEGDRFPVGELDGSRSERVAALARTLTAAGFTSRVLTDIRAHLWVKAWGNLAFNPISALTGGTLAEICQLPATRELAAEMMREAGAVAERLGLRLRISVEQRIEGAEKVGAHKTSMLQDVEAGRPLEIAPLIGAFVELGQLTETPMPATAAVYALVSLLDARLRKEAP